MATRKQNDTEPTQLFLFGDQPIVEEAPAPIAIIEDWRSIGSYFVATEEDAANPDLRIMRPREGDEGGVEESPVIAGELLVMGLEGPELARVPLRHIERLKTLVELRDAARRLLHAQKASAPDGQIAELREALNQVYDDFTARYGRLNAETFTAKGKPRRANLRYFESDPDFPLVAALEIDVEQNLFADEDEQVEKRFDKAPIFFRNTVNNDTEPTEAETPLDALNISLDRRGRVDTRYMAELLGQREGEVIEALTGEIFLNPETQQYETAAKYLSGPVRRKLRLARAAAEQDKRWLVNVQALEHVQPEDLTAEDIIPALGAPWIPVEDVQDFVNYLLDTRPGDVELFVDEHQAQWTLRVQNDGVRNSARARRTWGTARMHAIDLLDCAMNQRDPVVRDRIENDPPRYQVNRDATLEAREKMEEIKEEFRQWLWRDNDRTVRLCREYNDLYNDHVETSYDGEHLTLPGTDNEIVLRPHQKNAVWRGVQDQNSLLAHRVGYGKSWEQVAIIMEARRLGQARKPLWIVPTNMIDDLPRQFLQLYPMARLLVASKKDMSPQGREEFFARIVTSDADCVIMTHDQFTKLPISVDARRRILQDEIDALEREVPGEDRQYEQGRERKVRKLREKLEELENAQDNGITFEDTGIDALIVDESQNFKSIPIFSKNRELNDTGSTMAEELLLRVRHVNGMGGKVVFATGTPIANSILEVYVLMHYLHNDRLRELGIDHVDAWVAMFAEPVTKFELMPSGQYEAKTRFATFKNVPELRALLREFADVLLDKVEGLQVPDLIGGMPTDVAVEPSEWVQAYMQDLIHRVDRIKARQVRPDEDNMLKIVGDARKAALSPRLVDENAPVEGGKIQQAADEVARFYHETAEERAVQLVFCDLGTPKAGEFDVYNAFKEELIARGVNPGEVAFAQDAKGDGAKDMFDEAVNSGEIRIAIGSTQTLGTGRNVQRRARRLIHLDAPWRPCDMEQREGRIIRQGNRYQEVEILRYVVERSFDAFMYQTLERKAAFIYQVLSGNSKRRTIEDVDEITLSFKTIKAIASGDPLVREKAELESEIARLEKLVKAERGQRHSARMDLAKIPERRTRLEDIRTKLVSDIKDRVETTGDAFQLVTDRGTVVNTREDAGRILLTKFGVAEKRGTFSGSAIENAGTLGGFKISFEKNRGIEPEIIISNHGVYRSKIGKISYDDGRMDDELFAETLTARGLVQRVENMIAKLDEKLQSTERKIEALERDEANLRAMIDGDTPRERQLRELHERLREVDAELGIGVVDGDIPEEEQGMDEIVDGAQAQQNGGRFIDAIDREMDAEEPEMDPLERTRQEAIERARERARRAFMGG